MKGYPLIIKILIISAFAIGVVMAALNLHASWSQYSGFDADPLLYSCLFLISQSFMVISFSHQQKKLKLFNAFGVDVRFEHVAIFTAFMFGGIITFSVNSPVKYVELAHLLFTALGIVSGYILLLFYAKTKTARLWTYVAVAFGLIGFAVGYFFKVYSVAWAEVIASAPLAVFLFIVNNRDR
jgi:hypothetical protein